MKKSIMSLAAALCFSSFTFAQFRPTDKTGINVFETPKTETEFTGVKTKIGGAFTQSYQILNHSNTADVVMSGTPATNVNALVPIVNGFNLATANLVLRTQLADGVALNMELYLSSRHHQETWVKGGFIQFDKLPFINIDFVNNIMNYTTVKIGQMETNYGDAHFRRSDNGNAIYNPFIENNIMDEFATEIGFEADVNYNGIVGVAGITSGKLNANIVEGTPVTGGTDGIHKPAFIGKLGYDKQFNEDLRVRLTGSVYYTAGSLGVTMFGGDRTGSHYYGVMYNAGPSTSTAFNGRYNPGYLSDKVTALMGNLFVKYRGLEWFSTVESATGRSKTQTDAQEANTTQLVTDLVYRFGNSENFWVGARYNTVTNHITSPLTINRIAASAGWFITKNVMTKLEYVNQDYKDFPSSNILNGGNFNGFVLEAVVGF